MRSPVERLWGALGRGDWSAMAAQFVPDARVHDAVTGEAVAPAEYVTRARVAGRAEVTLERVISESNDVAVIATVGRDGRTRQCGAFYALRDGRIARVVEFWAGGPAEQPR